jgi:predicted RNase H-like HicB family nuclease
MDITLTTVFQQDGPWIVAWLEEWPGVNTQGATIEEARENLRDALQELIAARRELAARQLAQQTGVVREAFAVSA